MARLTLEIETRRDSTVAHGGRGHCRLWLAKLGQITGAGPTEAAAKADLRAIIESHAAHTTPRAVPGPNGSVVLAHAAECSAGVVCIAVFNPGAKRPTGYTMESIRGRSMTECARDHAEALS